MSDRKTLEKLTRPQLWRKAKEKGWEKAYQPSNCNELLEFLAPSEKPKDVETQTDPKPAKVKKQSAEFETQTNDVLPSRRTPPENPTVKGEFIKTYEYERTFKRKDGTTSTRKIKMQKPVLNPPEAEIKTRGPEINKAELKKDFEAGMSFEKMREKYHKGNTKLYDSLTEMGLKVYRYNKNKK